MAAHGDVVDALNTRAGGRIQGYRSIGSLLAPIPTWDRALGLEPDATPEFLTTPGQVAFTPEGGTLLVTTKGNTGAIEVFNVNARRLRRALPGWVRWPRPRPSWRSRPLRSSPWSDCSRSGPATCARCGRPTMRGRSQRSPVPGRRAVQRGALLILIGIPVYVRAAHGGAPRGTDRGTMSIERKQDG